jgi:hypothetical protein
MPQSPGGRLFYDVVYAFADHRAAEHLLQFASALRQRFLPRSLPLLNARPMKTHQVSFSERYARWLPLTGFLVL